MSLLIEVKDIPQEGIRLSGEISEQDVGLNYDGVEAGSHLRYDLTAEVVGHELLVRGSLAITVRMACSRCLKKVEREIKVANFSYNIHLSETTIIDLTPNMREDIIIALPLKPLCSDACRGICPTCGKDLNEGSCSCKPQKGDMRWDILDGMDINSEDD
jgi:uncharacterized protein